MIIVCIDAGRTLIVDTDLNRVEAIYPDRIRVAITDDPRCTPRSVPLETLVSSYVRNTETTRQVDGIMGMLTTRVSNWKERL